MSDHELQKAFLEQIAGPIWWPNAKVPADHKGFRQNDNFHYVRSNRMHKPILWRWRNGDKTNRSTIGVDIAVIDKQDDNENVFLFEVKSNIGLAFKECGYLQLAVEMYLQEAVWNSKARVFPYMVTRINLADVQEGYYSRNQPRIFLDYHPISKSDSASVKDPINAFVKATGLGFMLVDIYVTEIERLWVWEPCAASKAKSPFVCRIEKHLKTSAKLCNSDANVNSYKIRRHL